MRWNIFSCTCWPSYVFFRGNKCLFGSFANFLIGLFVFWGLLSCMSSFTESFKQTIPHDRVVHCGEIANLFLAPGGSAQSPNQSRERLGNNRGSSVFVSSQMDTHVRKELLPLAAALPSLPAFPAAQQPLLPPPPHPAAGEKGEENHFSQRASISVSSQCNCGFLTIFLGVSSAVGNKTAEVSII